MNSTEFNELAKDGDLTRVTISCYRDSYMTVSATLLCDNESQGLTAFNYLRDITGHILKFDHLNEAEKMIRTCGYNGRITLLGTSEKIT
ncbi:MAG: hypothetical protein ACREO1_15350 [Arenimonas sp.]